MEEDQDGNPIVLTEQAKNFRALKPHQKALRIHALMQTRHVQEIASMYIITHKEIYELYAEGKQIAEQDLR